MCVSMKTPFLSHSHRAHLILSGLGWSRLPLGDFADAWRAARRPLRQALRDQEFRDLAMGLVPTCANFGQIRPKQNWHCSLLKKVSLMIHVHQFASKWPTLQSNCQRIHYLSPLNHEHVIVHVRSALDVFI